MTGRYTGSVRVWLGVFETKMTIANVVDQLDTTCAKTDESPISAPCKIP